jgi:hypothetical protein
VDVDAYRILPKHCVYMVYEGLHAPPSGAWSWGCWGTDVSYYLEAHQGFGSPSTRL